MKLEYAFLADAAKVEENGLFSVLGGGFDILREAGKFPATKPAMVLLARIMVAPEECEKRHELLVQLVAPDGQTVLPEMRVPFVPFPEVEKPDPKNWITVALHYRDVTFPAPGEYHFRLSVGPTHLGQVRLEVIAKESEP
jgi:hypothetical protein